MDKFTQKTNDGTALNIAALKNLFPEVVSEGKVDFDALKTILGGEVAGDERYQFTWAGKRAAMIEASTPITKTLRPCIDESKDWEMTKNIFIEGDNLDALKILQNTYGGKVKMIYIDPPYNTGHDFIYHDNFHGTKAAEAVKEGSVDSETGERFKQNTESNGYFHSDWCSMMYPRLKLARNLLSNDGILMCSIDDSEVDSAKKLLNEILGEQNFVAQIVVDATPKNDPYIVSTAHEYCLVYCRDFNRAKQAQFGVKNSAYGDILKIYSAGAGNFTKIEADLEKYYHANGLDDDNISNYKYADKLGVFRIGPIDDPQSSGPKDERLNPKTGNPCKIPTRGWGCSAATWEQWKKAGQIYFPESDDKLPARKTYITTDRIDVMRAYVKTQTRKDTDFLKSLFDMPCSPFPNPKPVEMLRSFVENCQDKSMLVIDFFSGSATMANAVLLQNSIDNGNRHYIMVQYPEEIVETGTQSNKMKRIVQESRRFLLERSLRNNICEIGKERIRRVGEKIKAEHPLTTQNLDVGFRVFKVDSSNLEDVFFRPADYQQDHLLEMINNVKTGRTGLDLLFGCLLEWGLPIDLPTKARTDLGAEVYDVGEGRILACFDMNVTEAVVRAIAAETPDFAIFRDLSFTSSADKINVAEIFKTLSPNTKVKVL